MREIESPGGVQEHCERRRGLHVGRNRVERPRVRQGRGLLVAEALIEQAPTALLNQRELLRIGGRVGGVEQRRGLDLQQVRARSDVRDADVKSEICEAQRLDRAQLLERPLGILEPLLEEISRAQARDAPLRCWHVGRGREGAQRVHRFAKGLALHVDLDQEREGDLDPDDPSE